ncbi:exodeoxyribonuclease VII large subunit [Labedella endophytica]|uniref:Exodeoxyribonuclease 7 large subunit n=1 Tax=Labedella endophytica TaxID=1523160 RepID=A0A433JR35_9MICO|nr:exodeoxyribonuclease VII large subunit [Labedella endophytica]RUQ99204.1 exodeoxyribonuclease VII large subunit [Labedella endophytica]
MSESRTPRFPGGDGTTERGPATAESPWPVALLGAKLRDYIDRLGTIWVEGQITQWGVSGGNVYGKLKDLDADATVGFTVWSSVRAKIPADLKQGDHVLVLMKANYWIKGGSLTMQVLAMKHVGLGDLLERLERLRAQLASEGLFDASRKKTVPFLPHCIGLVTGKDSDAEKDVLRNAQLRWPQVEFRVAHAAVQGDRAVGEVVAAIERLDADPEVDVIIVARGGGDFQNLLAFSDEKVVRAAAAATTPLVSAIGHEADRPLLDEVADLRASTPTDAAKRVVPDVTEQSALVSQLRSRITVRLSSILSTETHRLEGLRSRPALAEPSWIIDQRAQDLTRYVSRGVDLAERAIERQERLVAESTSRLRALSPQRTLARGYTITQTEDGAIVRTAADAADGEVLRLTTSDGALGAVSTGPERSER